MYIKEGKRMGRGKTKAEREGKVFAMVFMTVLSLSACAMPLTGEKGEIKPGRVETGFIVAGPESFDSSDTAILVGKDSEAGTLTFRNLDMGRNYTLSVGGAAQLYDKYGDAISMDQLEKGDIVDVTFLKAKKRLTTLRLSAESWIYAGVERYEINPRRGEAIIGEETYKLTDNTQYLSEGRTIELIDLNAADVLCFQGIGHQILSVRVEKGHGYLRLEGDEKFIGGWIEVGQSVIRRITEEMLLLVPEGEYQVNISHKGGGGVKSVRIGRNEETVLDISDLEVPEPQTGTVLFSLTPSNAELYVDGTKVDASLPQKMEYGLHQLIARAEGYHSITRYIRVAQESLAFDLVLEAAGEGETDGPSSESGSSSSSSEPADTITDYYKVYVDAPVGAEVYLDGSYAGVAPCSFKKVVGSHVIILRMAGYETRSYTVQIDDTEKDVSYAFADLVKNGTESKDGSSSQSSGTSSGESSGTSSSQSSASSSQSSGESSASDSSGSG